MKAIGKLVGGFVALAVVLLIIVINFSGVQRDYDCTGTVTKDGKAEKQDFALRITKFRWWVMLWSDNQGNVWVEMPTKNIQYFETMKDDDIAIRFGENGSIYPSSQSHSFGQLSTISNVASIHLAPYGVLNGKCISREPPSRS